MYYVRVACSEDLSVIKEIADANKEEIGFILRAIFEASIKSDEVFVACKDTNVVGFVRWHRRRDGWSTVYEICVRRDFRREGAARLLLRHVPKPIRLKCPEDNASNTFYEHLGSAFVGKERGKKKVLNIWTLVC